MLSLQKFSDLSTYLIHNEINYTTYYIIVGLETTGNTGTTISLKWNKYRLFERDEFEEYQLEIKKKLLPNESPIIKASNTNNYIVQGLEVATTYNIRVRVKTINFGESLYSDARTVTTNAQADSPKTEVDSLKTTVVSI